MTKPAMTKIQQAFENGWDDFSSSNHILPHQRRAAYAIMGCKTGKFGLNASMCDECGYVQFHNNSCRNRNCPNCQTISNEIWIDSRRAEVVKGPYFHIVFTVPAELNPIIEKNQEVLYPLLHQCSAETILELCEDPHILGAMPGIIQVLHTWGQKLNYHPHIHCIVSGTGITRCGKVKTSGKHFFIKAESLAKKFKGKLLDNLNILYESGKLTFSKSLKKLKNSFEWKELINSLRDKTWCPYIRETFNGRGNAIEYLGRYANRIAITNSRITKVTKDSVTFVAKDYRNGGAKVDVTLTPKEFIKRFMKHGLPPGFQKIRYYGFLANRRKKESLRIIFEKQGREEFQDFLRDLPMNEIIQKIYGVDICTCPACGKRALRPAGHIMPHRE